MRAVILGGGEGRRLAGEPKAFLPFGPTRLIQIQLRILAQAGFRRPLIVADRRALEIADLVGEEAMVVDTYGTGTRQGLLMGLCLAGEDGAVVVHGDVLAPPWVFAELGEDSAVVLRPALPGKIQATCIPSEDGLRLAQLGAGEWQYAGILALSADSVRVALEVLGQASASEYWDALNPLLALREIRAVMHQHDYIVDIDTAEDSLRAHRDVWPRISGGG